MWWLSWQHYNPLLISDVDDGNVPRPFLVIFVWVVVNSRLHSASSWRSFSLRWIWTSCWVQSGIFTSWPWSLCSWVPSSRTDRDSTNPYREPRPPRPDPSPSRSRPAPPPNPTAIEVLQGIQWIDAHKRPETGRKVEPERLSPPTPVLVKGTDPLSWCSVGVSFSHTHTPCA